jgi:acetylglutamate kinase
MKELVVIKIGGNIIDNEKALRKFFLNYHLIKIPKILVHGGGKLATQLSEKLGIETKIVEGRRITDAETLNITTMVYAGLINKKVVAKLNAKGTKAIGLCGADAFLIPSTKRKKGKIDYGFVGDVVAKNINSKLISTLLKDGLCPIIAPITADSKGQLLNTNADTIASSLATSLSKSYKVKLVYCFEKQGVLHNEKVIPHINKKTYITLKEQRIVKDGMIPKLDNAFNAIESGVKTVVIGHADKLKQIIQSHAGTSITK